MRQADSNTVMLRKFAVSADAVPTDTDALVVDSDLTKVRLFLGKLQGGPIPFDDGFFRELYSAVHVLPGSPCGGPGGPVRWSTPMSTGVCDIAHSEGLFRAVTLEMSVNPVPPDTDLFEALFCSATSSGRLFRSPHKNSPLKQAISEVE